jgi:hypothetical protein
MPITREQFQEGIREMLDDIANPNGEFADIRNEFKTLYNDVHEHDAELATHLSEIMHAMDRMMEYVETRAS